MTVSATLKGPIDSFGRRTVYIRIMQNGHRSFKRTGVKVEPIYWKKKVVNHPDSRRLNSIILGVINRVEAGDLPETSLSFNEYAEACLLEWEHTKRYGTLKKLKSKIGLFKEFSNPLLEQVTPALLNKYVNHCFGKRQKQNTVWTSLAAIRVIIKNAYREKLIKEDPFMIFKMPKYKDPPKTFLTKQQVDLIDSKTSSLPWEYKFVGAWFVIACYTGLRFGDQVNFNKNQIKGDNLIIYTSKTGEPVSFKMMDKYRELLERIDYKPMNLTNQHYNRVLKAIMIICEIEEVVTVHTARHTFATLCASAGISQEVTAKLMGHSSIRTTAIYYKLTSDRINKELEKLF